MHIDIKSIQLLVNTPAKVDCIYNETAYDIKINVVTKCV